MLLEVCTTPSPYPLPSLYLPFVDVLPGQSPWPLLPLRLLSVSKCNCCGGLCHQVHTIHIGKHHLSLSHCGCKVGVVFSLSAGQDWKVIGAFPPLSRSCRGIKVNYSGVWLILMLLFNQVVYTSASVLNCPMMRDENGAVNMVCE